MSQMMSGAQTGAMAGSAGGPWGMAIGAGVGAIGGYFAGQEENRSKRKARDWYGDRTGEGAERLGSIFYGPDTMADMVDASRGDYDAQTRITGRLGGSVYDQMRGVSQYGQDATAANLDRYDADTASLRGMNAGNMAAMLAQLRGDTGDVIGQIDQVGPAVHGMYDKYDRDWARQYNAGAGNLARTVDNFGKGREQIIRRDAGKAEADAQGEAAAQLAASGFGGSTTAAVTRAGIKRATNEGVQDRLQELGDQQTDRQTALQAQFLADRSGQSERSFSNRAGNLMALNAARINTLESGAARRGSAAASMYGQRDANEYARAGGRAAISEAAIDRTSNYKMMPLQALLGVQQGSVMNPWLNQNTTGYYPGASGVGSAMVSGGNALAGMGAMATMANMYGNRGQAATATAPSNVYQSNNQLEMLRANGYGG